MRAKKKMRVHITGEEKVYYSQYVEMTEEEFQRFNNSTDEENEGWFDRSDVHDSGGMEETEATKVKEEVKK